MEVVRVDGGEEDVVTCVVVGGVGSVQVVAKVFTEVGAELRSGTTFALKSSSWSLLLALRDFNRSPLGYQLFHT